VRWIIRSATLHPGQHARVLGEVGAESRDDALRVAQATGYPSGVTVQSVLASRMADEDETRVRPTVTRSGVSVYRTPQAHADPVRHAYRTTKRRPK
jgi:hypothetical protein